MAALGSLLSLGKNGFRRLMANQMECTFHLRKRISKEPNFIVSNGTSLGFNTMVVLVPQRIFGDKKKSWANLRQIIERDEHVLAELNSIMKSFYGWCLKTDPLGCSFSSSFYQTKDGRSLSRFKYCIVSPNITKKSMDEEIAKLTKMFDKFIYLKK